MLSVGRDKSQGAMNSYSPHPSISSRIRQCGARYGI